MPGKHRLQGQVPQGLKREVHSRIFFAYLSLCTEIHSRKTGRKLFIEPGSYTWPVIEGSSCLILGWVFRSESLIQEPDGFLVQTGWEVSITE